MGSGASAAYVGAVDAWCGYDYDSFVAVWAGESSSAFGYVGGEYCSFCGVFDGVAGTVVEDLVAS